MKENFTSYNKSELHYKVKVIFFFISQIKIYWLNVSISFVSLYIKVNRTQVVDRGKPAWFVRNENVR
jgi:hypothetical protein